MKELHSTRLLVVVAWCLLGATWAPCLAQAPAPTAPVPEYALDWLQDHLVRKVPESDDLRANLAAARALTFKLTPNFLRPNYELQVERAARTFVHLGEARACDQRTFDLMISVLASKLASSFGNQVAAGRLGRLLYTLTIDELAPKCRRYLELKHQELVRKKLAADVRLRQKLELLFSGSGLMNTRASMDQIVLSLMQQADPASWKEFQASLGARDAAQARRLLTGFYEGFIVAPCRKYKRLTEDLGRMIKQFKDHVHRWFNLGAELMGQLQNGRECDLYGVDQMQINVVRHILDSFGLDKQQQQQ